MTSRILGACAAALLMVAPALGQTAPGSPATVWASTDGAPAAPAGADPVMVKDGPAPMAAGWTPMSASGQFWATSDYIFAWFRDAGLPPLVTTSALTTPREKAGVLGEPTTGILFGNGPVDDNIRSGIHLEMGYWFDPERTWGVETGFMIVESQAAVFFAASNGTTILARPYTDVTNFTEQAALIAFPGASSGTVDARASSGNLYEWHFDFTENILDTGCFRLDTLVGYRFFRYDEGLRIRSTINPTGAAFVPGTEIITVDEFGTQNTFHGIDFGLRGTLTWQDLSVEMLVKLAAGHTLGRVDISGSQVTTAPGSAPVVDQGGLLALNSNIGNHHANTWAAIPELGFNIAYRVSPNIRIRAGYSVLAFEEVLRAGAQVDTRVNPNLLPPSQGLGGSSPNPFFSPHHSDLWVQSINLGVEFNF